MEIKAKSINRPYGTYYLSFLFDFLNVFFSNHRIRRRMKKKKKWVKESTESK